MFAKAFVELKETYPIARRFASPQTVPGAAGFLLSLKTSLIFLEMLHFQSSGSISRVLA